MDSGAADHVTNKGVAPQCPIKKTPAVGIKYTVADGRSVYNEGQKDIKGYTANGNPIELGVQVTDVAKTLFSVKKMKDAGNIVIFGADEGDMILNKATGLRTPITDTGKEFVLDIYVPGGEGHDAHGEGVKSVSKEDEQDKITYGCKATRGGYWNSLMQEDDGEENRCHTCCPATFRRHP